MRNQTYYASQGLTVHLYGRRPFESLTQEIPNPRLPPQPICVVTYRSLTVTWEQKVKHRALNSWRITSEIKAPSIRAKGRALGATHELKLAAADLDVEGIAHVV